MAVRLKENAAKYETELQHERDEVSRLKRELAKVEEQKANYEKAAAADKKEWKEKLEMAEVSAFSATESCEALLTERARWLKELTRINHEMNSKCL